MVTRSILRFLLKAVLLTLPVVVPAVAFYAVVDPFKSVGQYDCYFDSPQSHPFRIGLNKGMITVRNYEQQVARGGEYNAFIFGSSISIYYDATEWAQLLGEDAKPYHFDSSAETLERMAAKVEYLHRRGDSIKYALVVLDPLVMNAPNNDNIADINPPELSRNPLYGLKFHYLIFRAATNVDFFRRWLPAVVRGKLHDPNPNPLFNPQPIIYDPVTNSESMPEWDRLIEENPEAYAHIRRIVAAPSCASVSEPVLTAERIQALQRVARVFAAQGTDYQIIIGPNRMKVTLNPADLRQFHGIFTPERVHDYTTLYAPLTESDSLLYDRTHYRPPFAHRLLRRCYKQ